MNTTLLRNQAVKEVERAKTQAAIDAKAAQLAHELARAAKVNLKHARKLSKMARKSARKAEDRAEESSVTLETAQAKLEMLRQQIRNEHRKNNLSPKPKPGKTITDTTPGVSPVQSQRAPKPVTHSAHGARRLLQKTVNGKPAKPAPAVAPEPKPVIAAPSFIGQEPTND